MTTNSTELTFTFTIEEANLLLAGLQELPAKLCNPLSGKIQQQAAAQLKQADDSPAAE
jgi:hypothetical protein